MNQHFATVGLRAWWAWQCLPRDEAGRPPPIRRLEEDNDLSNGQLGKLIGDRIKKPSYETIDKAASALGCSTDWLGKGVGEAPLASFPVQPRPASLSEIDVETATAEVSKAPNHARERVSSTD